MDIFDLIDPFELTAAARTLPEDPRYTLNGALPDQVVPSIEYEISEVTSTNTAARFRSWDAPVELGTGPTFTRKRGEMPPLGEGYVVGEYLRLLEEQMRGSNIEQALQDAALNKVRQGVGAIRARMEVARGQVLSTGAFTLSGEGGLHGITADFEVPAGNFVSAATDWSDTAGADITGDLTEWVQRGEDESGFRPDRMIVGRSVAPFLMNNEALRAIFANAFGASLQLSLTQVNQVLASLDLPTIALTADGRPVRPAKVAVRATDNASTSNVDTFPANMVALYPDAMLGRTLWGPTFEGLELASTGVLEARDAPGIIALTYKQGNPGQLLTVVNAVGLPVLDTPSGLVVGTVTAA